MNGIKQKIIGAVMVLGIAVSFSACTKKNSFPDLSKMGEIKVVSREECQRNL